MSEERIIAFCSAVLLGALAVGCAGETAAVPEDRAEKDLAMPVEVVPCRLGTLPLEERLSGTVRAENQVSVRAEIEAPIVEVLVRSGDVVERGQPLVRLDGAVPGERLRQAEASLRVAEATTAEARARRSELEARIVRMRTLAEQELISELELETLEAQLLAAQAAAAQAEASVDEARATVGERRTAAAKTVVRSPVSGRVGRRNAEVGMIADPGLPLFTVGNLDELIVEVQLTEGMLGHIEEGQSVIIRSPALRGEPLRAELARISPFLEPGSFSTTGEVDVPNPGHRLKPGMFVTVDVLYGESEQATVVPSSALWEDPSTGRWGVYVVDLSAGVPPPAAPGGDVDAQPRPVDFRPVEVLAEGHDRAGLRGVEPGEWVVVLGQHLLRPDGASARVRVTTWERVLELQGLQREDLLRGYLEKQQRWARDRGASPPTNEEFLRGRLGGEGPAEAAPDRAGTRGAE